jgi:hypothetical protein
MQRLRRRAAFSLDTFSDRTFNLATVASVLTLILATVLGPLQKLLETTSLDVQQWLICICVALSIIVVSEARKAIRRRAGGRDRPGRNGITRGRVTTLRDGADSIRKPFRNKRETDGADVSRFPCREAESADCDRSRW